MNDPIIQDLILRTTALELLIQTKPSSCVPSLFYHWKRIKPLARILMKGEVINYHHCQSVFAGNESSADWQNKLNGLHLGHLTAHPKNNKMQIRFRKCAAFLEKKVYSMLLVKFRYCFWPERNPWILFFIWFSFQDIHQTKSKPLTSELQWSCCGNLTISWETLGPGHPPKQPLNPHQSTLSMQGWFKDHHKEPKA